MKSNKEILKVMLDNINLLDTGLCLLKHQIPITESEKYKIDRYLEKHLPKKNYYKAMRYKWKTGDKEPRIKWLKKQIKLLTK